jgi:branched-chain amino acid transport system ATP-binding protein
VRENLELAGFGFAGFRASRQRTERKGRLQAALERFPLLEPHLPKLAGMLSGGEQQILAIARGMMTEPALLMVDEPSLGLAPQMVESVYDLLVHIAAEGTAVLLVEQNVTLAFEITHRAYVLQQGRMALSGPSAELADDPRVVAAYLGAEEPSAPEPAAPEPGAPEHDAPEPAAPEPAGPAARGPAGLPPKP